MEDIGYDIDKGIWLENNCQGDHLAYSLISLKAGILLETFKVIFSLVNMNVAFT